jgi:ferredoxin
VTGRWRVHVNTEQCVGSGICVSMAPEHFTFNEQHRSQPVIGSSAPDQQLRSVAGSCPVDAILLTSSDDEKPIDLT